MSNLAILGAQWGDEGKGKIVDLLCEKYDVVVRFQGGNNAGHTVKVKDDVFKLHYLPSGVIHGKQCVLGNGLVIEPLALLAELEKLGKKAKLAISNRAHVILPYHRVLDWAKEHDAKIGTTLKGIGPAYEDKIARSGIRMRDLLDKDLLKKKVAQQCEEKVHRIQVTEDKLHTYMKESFSEFYDETHIFSVQKIVEQYHKAGCALKDSIVDVTCFLQDKKSILFEGAQGTLLDVDHGTYPYVTSSNTTIGNVFTGSGYGGQVEKRAAIVKAYTTRVGEGPFVTELEDDAGTHMREQGHEYGTTTGRPRRCGWLDLVAIKYAHALNGFTHLIITKLDVLSGLSTLKVCTAYKDATVPVYEELPGWEEDITGVTSYDALPTACKAYLKNIEKHLGVPIALVSVGPERNQTIIRKKL